MLRRLLSILNRLVIAPCIQMYVFMYCQKAAVAVCTGYDGLKARRLVYNSKESMANCIMGNSEHTNCVTKHEQLHEMGTSNLPSVAISLQKTATPVTKLLN